MQRRGRISSPPSLFYKEDCRLVGRRDLSRAGGPKAQVPEAHNPSIHVRRHTRRHTARAVNFSTPAHLVLAPWLSKVFQNMRVNNV